MSSLNSLDLSKLPRHIAIIMDGNGRWAKKRGLPRVFGHRAGVKTVREIVEACSGLKLEVLSLYAFSTENWSRPATEVRGLMGLLNKYLRAELADMMKNNIRFRTIGDISRLPESTREIIKKAKESTNGNTGLILNLALNYGSRYEIVRAMRDIIKDGHSRIDEETVSRYLDTAGLPDPDLLIRTSGEQRISNFMLWQIAYAEFYFTSVFWPDFHTENLYEAIREYQNRERRFGGI